MAGSGLSLLELLLTSKAHEAKTRHGGGWRKRRLGKPWASECRLRAKTSCVHNMRPEHRLGIETTVHSAGRVRVGIETTVHSAGRLRLGIETTVHGAGRVRLDMETTVHGAGRVRPGKRPLSTAQGESGWA